MADQKQDDLMTDIVLDAPIFEECGIVSVDAELIKIDDSGISRYDGKQYHIHRGRVIVADSTKEDEG
jgi:hypothetical protein